MKPKLLILCSLLFLAAPRMQAQRFSCNLEWGFSGTVYTFHSSHYTTVDGYHMDPRYYDNLFHTHGFVSLRTGIRAGRRLSVDFCTGYYGLQYELRSIPAGLRATWDFGKDPDGAGLLGYAEGGIGFSDETWEKNADYARIGAGWRVPLGEGISLKFLFSGQLSMAHPVPYDPFDDMYVDPARLSRSDRICMALSVSMAIGF